MDLLNSVVGTVDSFVWGPVMLILLVGTGVFLTFKLRFRTWRNLGYALRSVLGSESRKTTRGTGDVSPFSALMTALAATIGTGNIVGVATAMFAGGPGALVWMWISACFGLTTKFSECMLSIKYRTVNEKGEMSGGPMYTMKRGFKNKRFGSALGWLFALFATLASFGIGNLSQANSISNALKTSFGIPLSVCGIVLTVLTLIIVIGGIKSISRVSSVVVPCMAVFYVIAGIIVIIINHRNLPSGLYMIFTMAFNPKAVGGGVLGTITVSVMNSIRYGVSRGCFSNQGYINMTGTFFDTIVVCTITGLAIASSGMLGQTGADGQALQGVQLTMAAFSSALGPAGSYLVSIGIVLFAFSTILGWEYHGEKAFEYIVPRRGPIMAYRIIFSLIVYVGATQALDLVWNISDIMNALMAIPNLISLIVLSGTIKEEVERFQPILEKEKKARKAHAGNAGLGGVAADRVGGGD